MRESDSMRSAIRLVVFLSNGRVWYALATFLYVDILGMFAFTRVLRLLFPNCIIQQTQQGEFCVLR
jgi:hypothetical protein